MKSEISRHFLSPRPSLSSSRVSAIRLLSARRALVTMTAIAVKPTRIRNLNTAEIASGGGGVTYWMGRDARVQDNWALLHAAELAAKHGLPLSVVYCMPPPSGPEATLRRYDFLLGGLAEVEAELGGLGVPFRLLRGAPADEVPAFAKRHGVRAIVTDFSPLRAPRGWKEAVAAALPATPLIEVDAHNVVPVWVASDKQEVGARTLRRKITDRLPEYLREIPKLTAADVAAAAAAAPAALKQECKAEAPDWAALKDSLDLDRSVGPCDEWCEPGAAAALRAVAAFCEGGRLKAFGTKRNDPNAVAASDLSPYLNFGHLSAQRMALIVKEHSRSHNESVASFLEESIVRRELADNFCFYQPHYDSLEGAAGWAAETLRVHAADPREHTYTLEQMEKGKTHEDVWNAAQLQLVGRGKMHGFMRMYWAKKILEWSPTPAEALRRALYLNDKYELDGADPNGFVGCAWSVMGTHDMGWAERAVFGKIRYMNYNGCKRKFDIARFVATWGGGSGGTQAKLGARVGTPPTKKAKK